MVKHIFYCPFTGKGLHNGYRGDEWFKLRADIFINYTLKSLIHQQRKDFILWVSFRPEELFNPITKKIAQAITKSKIENIISFNGIMMVDDKVAKSNKTLKRRLDKVLPQIEELVGDADYIYETNLDSDDMLHKWFSHNVQGKSSKWHGALYMKKGFVYNINGRLANWDNPTSQQNYTIMFPRDIYFNSERRLTYLGGLKTHEEVPEMFDSEELDAGMYCSVIHGTNISTVWEHPFMGEEIPYEDEKEKILSLFK